MTLRHNGIKANSIRRSPNGGIGIRILMHFYVYISPSLFWVRIFGVGFLIKDTRTFALTFSERELGFGIQAWRYRLRWLSRLG